MSIRNDYHIHSEISPDGKSDMEHMCQSAIEKKIQEIVFTDHYECYAYGVRSKYFDSEYVRTYFEHIEKVQKKYQGILNVKSGIELGQSYLNPSEAKNVLNHSFDYVIGSVHKLGNMDLGWIQFKESNVRCIGDTYYRCLEELAKKGEYDCIGHLDYYKKHCARARLSDQFEYYRPIIKKILKYIIERGKGIEVNTAIDYVIKVDNLTLGQVNRTTREYIFCGGKGINVSHLLANLGVDSVGLGFIAGFTGDVIESGAKELGFKPDFIRVREGMTRINVKVKSNEESEINGLGPVIHDDELEQMFKKLDELEDGDILVLAGSIPATLPSDVYERIMGRLQGKDIRIVVDATKDLLLNVLKYHPFLIKPNNHELGEMFDVVLKTNDEIVEYAKKLQEKGARNVLVSMAGDGAILITEEGEVHVTPCPKGEVKNSVGAGDSMVAGFITGYLRSNGDYNEALKMGTAAGSATAFSEDVATGEKIMELYKTL